MTITPFWLLFQKRGTPSPDQRVSLRPPEFKPAGAAFSYRRAFAWFAIPGLILLLVAHLDQRPFAVFPIMTSGVSMPIPNAEGFAEGQTVAVRFPLPGNHPSKLHYPFLFTNTKQRVHVKVTNESRNGAVAADQVLARGDVLKIQGNHRAGDRMCMEMTWQMDLPPQLLLADGGDPVSATENGRAVALTQPLVQLSQAKIIPTGVPGNAKPYPLKPNQPLTVKLKAAQPDLEWVWVPGLIADPLTRAKVILRNETRNAVLKESVAVHGKEYAREFPPYNAAGDELSLTVEWLPIAPPQMLGVTTKPSVPIEASMGSTKLSAAPAFFLEYAWPSRWLMLGWIAVPVVLFFAMRGSIRAEHYLAMLGLAGFLTGYLSWQQGYSFFTPHFDPDSYGQYAQMMSGLLSGKVSYQEYLQWDAGFMYSHIVLTPLVLMIVHACGLPWDVAYCVVAGFSCFGVLLVGYQIATRWLKLSANASLLTVTLLGSHIIFLKAFGRASTDGLGLLLVLVTLAVILQRMERLTWKGNVALIILFVATALSRPPGLAYLPFFGGAAALCDAVRMRKIDIPGTIKTAVILTLPTVLILAALYASFGWFNDIAGVGLQKENPKWANWAGFTYCMVPMLNLLPFLILTGVWFHWQAGKEQPMKLEVMVATGVLAGWVLYYLTLIVATRAEFVHRLMLPMVPALVVLAGYLISRMELRAPRLTAFATVAVCAVNVALVIYCLNLPTTPPLPLGHYIY